jgi:hypothetical protein
MPLGLSVALTPASLTDLLWPRSGGAFQLTLSTSMAFQIHSQWNRDHSIAAHGASSGFSWGYCFAKAALALEVLGNAEPDSRYDFPDDEPDFWKSVTYVEGWMVSIDLSPMREHVNCPAWNAHGFLLDPAGAVIDPLQGKRALVGKDFSAHRSWIPVFEHSLEESQNMDWIPWANGQNEEGSYFDLLPEMQEAKQQHRLHFEDLAAVLHDAHHKLTVAAA